MYCVAHSPECIAPTKATPESAGYDLSSIDALTIAPGERQVVSTGLSITCPPGTYGRLAPRSGLALRHGIDVLAGVIDPDYTGIVKVILLNTGREPFRVEQGMRVCQLIFESYDSFGVSRYMPMKFAESGTEVPRETQRGSKGFGSSGDGVTSHPLRDANRYDEYHSQ